MCSCCRSCCTGDPAHLLKPVLWHGRAGPSQPRTQSSPLSCGTAFNGASSAATLIWSTDSAVACSTDCGILLGVRLREERRKSEIDERSVCGSAWQDRLLSTPLQDTLLSRRSIGVGVRRTRAGAVMGAAYVTPGSGCGWSSGVGRRSGCDDAWCDDDG